MKHPVTLLLACLAFAPRLASASAPDLCGDVWRDVTGAPIDDSNGMTLSRFCEWTNDVEPWGDYVCCTVGASSATCLPTVSGRCTTGARYWCDYAVASEVGVHCQQPWPDACGEGFCSSVLPQGATPVGNTEPLCCIAVDVCTVVDTTAPPSCGGDYVMCEAPFTNVDGSVGCSDDD